MVVYLYLPLFLLFTPVSIYLLIKMRGQRLVVWGALVCFIIGMSGLQIGLEKIVIPYWGESGVKDIWLSSARFVSGILNIAINTFPYYLILMFFIYYADYSKKTILNAILLVPVLLSFALSDIYPYSRVNFPFILVWGVPYALCAAVLLGRVWLKEKFVSSYRKHVNVAFIFLVPEAFLVLFQLEGSYTSSRMDFLIYIPFLCVIGIVLGFVQYLNNAFHSSQDTIVLTKMQLGVSLMQHAFKNAIGKNKLNALNIRRSLIKQNYDEIDHHLHNLLATNDHLLKMVSKLSYLTQSSITAELEPCDISSVLDEVIETFRDEAMFSFVKQYSPMVLPIDRTLIAECFTNVIRNAIEATDGRGCITVSLERVKRNVLVVISDTGKGMDKEQLKRVFEPFFSTKLKSGRNFGLGMFHIKKIMNAHRGKVEVASEAGEGTVVTLVFPLKNKD